MTTVTRDAQARAGRTFWQGLGIDLLISIAGTLILVLADSPLVWTKEYWAALGTLVLKTVLTSAASYAARFWAPPGS